ncbi:MAG: penicillin acylase family protein, partial [Myxococcota bacterium]
EVPKVVETDQGRLWSANNRIVGPELRGAARYRNPVMGARARQIRDGLFAKDRLSERDLLAIQLDDRATFLAPWRGLMLDALTESSQAAMRQAVEDWSGRADVESVGYRVVKAFRTAMLARIVDPLLAPARRLTEEAEGVNVAWARPRNIEHMLWTLLEARPEGLWPNGEESWAAAIDAAVADVQDKVAQAGGLDQFTWGSANRSAIRHPLSGAVPLLGQWLDLPSIPLPGDTDMPRVQRPDFGASERFVVSPGREAKGIFHMPGGQASHPLSSYLHAGHEAWATGAPTPFLPGDKAWTFTLVPATRDSPRK